ncbi:MAG: helix-turn-helix transcriptional regulator [Candidatus Omnitrophica bacterium]|nr:helix-turn-helix transcriptional regulator [Candidatus Omnitrophota bacterium]
MTRGWLWDRKISLSEVKRIFKDPAHKNFILLASLLLARKNEPQEVFKEYLDPVVFCAQWSKIKKSMRKDKWTSQRIVFWQAIYEKLIEKYRKKGISFRKRNEQVISDLCKKAGAMIRSTRKEQDLSQKNLAAKLGVSQQLVSRIEKGRENVSLVTLATILKALNKKLHINIES